MPTLSIGSPSQNGARFLSHSQDIGCWSNADLLNSLRINNGLTDITNPAAGTCSWLFQHSQYKSWIGKPSGSFWLSGKPGSGKSVLTRYILQQWENDTSSRPSQTEDHVFFFSFDATKRRNSITAMLKSLLYQALITMPLLITKALAETYEDKTELLGTPGIKWEWGQEELKRHFQDIVCKTASWSQTVVVFVDALDECDEYDSVASYFLADLPSTSIRVLISSRLNPPLAGVNKVRLEENNQTDIRSYIRSKLLNECLDSEQFRISQIMNAAGGNFLWVKLVLANADSALDTNEILWLPQSLKGAYESVMSHIMTGHDLLRQKYARKVLRFATYTLRPVTIEELCDGLALGNFRSSAIHESIDHMEKEIHNISSAASIVEYVSGGLLELVEWNPAPSFGRNCGTPSLVVSFLHRSVKEFLLQETTLWGETSITAHESHLEIAWECFSYIEQTQEGTIITKETANRSKPFLHYALLSGMSHLRLAMEVSVSPLAYNFNAVWEMLKPNFIDHWILIFNSAFGDHRMFQYEKTTPLHVLAYFDVQPSDKTMLEKINNKDHEGRTPLLVAATMGHRKICELLLQMGADCSIRDDVYGLTPLGWATACGNVGVAKLLIESGSDVNDYESGYTALHIALRFRQTDIVGLLLDHGADPSLKDKYSGQTVMSSAAWLGHVPTVDLLLSHGANIMSKDDGTGWTPFHHAISKGHKRTLEYLFDSLQKGQDAELEAYLNEVGPYWMKRLSLKRFIFSTSCHGSNEPTSTRPTQNESQAKRSSTNSRSNGLRKSSKRQHTDFSDSDDEEQDDDLNRSRKFPRKSIKNNKRLACPYHQRCPEMYSAGACVGTGFPTMNRLKLGLTIRLIQT